ncbi:uncharacterized protein LOC126410021 isoform X1 [Nymphaea colorata]|nr:uncharacterized protein LOC126410021 isoform X1 [Nymphaea colorata]
MAEERNSLLLPPPQTLPPQGNDSMGTVAVLPTAADIQSAIASTVPRSIYFNGSNSIPLLDDSNYAEWKENVVFTLGYMDLDMALRRPEPPPLTPQSTRNQTVYFDKCERSNRLSMLLLQSGVDKNIRGAIPPCRTVREFLDAVEAQFVSSHKTRASTLMSKLISMKYQGGGNIRQHMLEMRNIASQLNDMKLTISESFLIFFTLTSLPAEYTPFKISYSTHNTE